MRKSILALTGLIAAVASQPAFAQDEDSSAITVSGSATVVSDYRFRGLSQTDKRFAVQGGITVTHESGFYVSVWGSSIDDYIANTSDQEIDLIAGYSHTFGAATVDVGVLYYYYPGSDPLKTGYNSDFFEPYASIKGTFGPATVKASVAYAPKQKAIYGGTHPGTKDDNLYTALDLSGSLGDTGIGLTAHLGHSFGPSFLVPQTAKPGIEKGYTDWSVGATYTWKAITFGVSYVDTNTSLITFTGRDAAKGGVVGSVGVAF